MHQVVATRRPYEDSAQRTKLVAFPSFLPSICDEATVFIMMVQVFQLKCTQSFGGGSEVNLWWKAVELSLVNDGVPVLYTNRGTSTVHMCLENG